MDQTAIKSFYKLCLSTLIAVYVLVLVGSVVRSTGSGMGCPDWPKCFGAWFPPSSVEGLPSNYKEIYSAARVKKNVKFTRFLRSIGLEETARQLEADKTVLQEEDFSPLKSKIEYINRLVGVVIGFMISMVLLRAFKFRKSKPAIFIAALVAWISVVFTGWFGSIVVSTNLTPWTVSVHLGFAILIVGLLIYIVYTTSTGSKIDLMGIHWLVWTCLIISFVQMVLGVQVREALDAVAYTISDRSDWIASLGLEFIIHRSFSWIVMLSNLFLAYKMMKIFGNNWRVSGLAALTLGSILTGVGMAYGSVPAFLQPLHLLLSALIFGLLLLMVFEILKLKRVNYA